MIDKKLPVTYSKIYNRYNDSLVNIYPDLLCLEKHYLN